MLDIGFDVISDLNLEPNDNFNWEDKATSLYCILSGNISSDVQTMVNVLSHLSRFYQGVFYTPGLLEYDSSPLQNINQRTADIQNISKKLPNVILLHHNIVIIDGIAIVGANCWENAHEPGKSISIDDLKYNQYRLDDMSFLHKTIDKLQRHLDVKKIVLVSNAVPNNNCYFGEVPPYVGEQIPLDTVLNSDTEGKVCYWVYGSYTKPVDATLLLPRKTDLQVVSNPLEGKNSNQFYPKRITISV
jgi:hypothetical protein